MKNIKYILFTILVCFVGIYKINALTCTYKSSDITLTCNVNHSVSCALDKSNVTYVPDRMSLKVSDFLNNGYIDCNNIKNIYLDLQKNNNNQYRLLEIKKENICVRNMIDKAQNPAFYQNSDNSSNCTTFTLTSSTQAEKKDLSDIIISNSNSDNNQSNDSSNENSNNSSSSFNNNVSTSIIGEIRNFKSEKNINESGASEFDKDTFCNTRIQGVFTTLGWIFFIVKIIIPIVLIVMGSIDFFKAAIGNKDDEVKKAAHTLVRRAIAGIIIFFIPTIIGFVVNLTDQNDTYKGTFKDCTKCMLDPSGCKGLGD